MELKRIFKFRNLWIGIAMLWIVFFHAGFWIGIEELLVFKNLGYGGVDICLFASGIGCYFSLEKNPDTLEFLRRRIKRLGPTYLCFIIPWVIWRRLAFQLPLRAVVGNLLGIQTLVSWDYHFNWYIGGLVVYYLAMPLLKQLTDSISHMVKELAVILLLFAVSVPFWNYGNTIVILSRLPVLYAGLVFAKLSKQGYMLKKRDLLLLGLLSVVGAVLLVTFYYRVPDLLWPRGLYWYPFALIVPGVCVFFSLVAEKTENCKILRWGNRLLETVGVYSFELYLIHVFLYEGLMPGIAARLWMVPANILWAMTIPVVVAGTCLLNRAVALICRLTAKQKA